jgi:hypothetical protein
VTEQDPWAVPDPADNPWAYAPRPVPPNAPGWGLPPGWGPPPGTPTRTRTKRRTEAVLAALLAFVLAVAGIAVVVRSRPTPRAAPGPAAPTRTATPSPRPKPKPKPSAKPAATKPPAPVRTYAPPKDGIPVTGRVVDTNGRPVTDAAVTMTRHEGFFEGLGRVITIFGTFGLACLSDEVCTVPYGEARTDSTGHFTLFLKHDVDDYDVVVTKNDAAFEVRVDFDAKPMTLGTIAFWSPSPHLDRSGTTARIRFATAPRSLGSVEGYAASVGAPKGDGEPYVSVESAHSGDAFDARIVEDVAARLVVRATVHTRLGKATYSAGTAVRGAYRPMSRGRGCVEYGSAGSRRRGSCQLTDGDLADSWKVNAGYTLCKKGASCDQAVAVDLGSVRTIRFVTLQGCDTFFDVVEASNDGMHWRTLVEQHTEPRGCARAVSGTARYVRVKGAFYSSRREIAVF